jgi:putative methyltransferase (TIGR04325 family)
MRARAVLQQITPPVVQSAWRRRRSPSTWEYVGEQWPADPGPGWDTQGVVDAYRRKLPEFRAAIAAPTGLGVSTEPVSGVTPAQYHQNVALEVAYAVARASDRRDHISVLDWGGGFGFLSFVIAELFPDLVVDYTVKDVPSVARAARELVPDVTFADDDACLDETFDLVIAASSLQYAPDWRAALTGLGRAARLLLVNRLPVTLDATSFVARQHAYATSYCGWTINRDDLVAAAAQHDLVLARELLEGWSAPVAGAPGTNEHRGFLFLGAR